MINRKKRFSVSILSALALLLLFAFAYKTSFLKEDVIIPASLSNISKSGNDFIFKYKNQALKLYTIEQENQNREKWTLSQFDEVEKGTENGIDFHFKKDFNGTLIYGLYGDEPMDYPIAVYFKRHEKIEQGKASINIRKKLSGKYDLANWEKYKKGRLAYRVLDDKNNIIINKSISFVVDKEFKIVPDLVWGPFLSKQTTNKITLRFATNQVCSPVIMVNNKNYELKDGKYHEITISNLEPGKSYEYKLQIGDITHSYKLTTAPNPSNESKFTFAIASDSRGGTQLGETNTKGHNADILRKYTSAEVIN